MYLDAKPYRSPVIFDTDEQDAARRLHKTMLEVYPELADVQLTHSWRGFVGILPAMIARFKQKYPDVMVSLEMRSEPTILRWTASGYCDLGFATAPPDAVGVVIEPLYSVPGVCVMPAGHRLLKKKQVQASDFANESLVLPSYAVATRAALDRALSQAGVNQVPSVETPYGSTICALVAEVAGISRRSGSGTRGSSLSAQTRVEGAKFDGRPTSPFKCKLKPTYSYQFRQHQHYPLLCVTREPTISSAHRKQSNTRGRRIGFEPWTSPICERSVCIT